MLRACHFGAAPARMSLGAPQGLSVRAVDASPVARVTHDAEVTELQSAVVADEHVHRGQVPVEHLAAMKPAEDLENPGDLAPRGLLGPPLPGALEIGAQVAVLRVLERETVEDAAVLSHQGKRVEDADRAGVPRQKLAEVGLAEPAVHLLARLDRDDGRDREGARHPLREVGLAETALAEQAVDPILEPGLRARDDLLGEEQSLPSGRAREPADMARVVARETLVIGRNRLGVYSREASVSSTREYRGEPSGRSDRVRLQPLGQSAAA